MKPGWEVRPLGEVAVLKYGKALPRTDRNPDGAIPAFGANGVKDRTNRPLSDGPSIIIGRKGSAGEVTFVEGPFWPLDVTYYVDHDRQATDLRYLDYWLRDANLQSLARGVKPGLNRNDVYALDFPLPPLDEQRRIVAVLDEAFEGLARARGNTEANLADAEGAHSAMLRDALADVAGAPCKRLSDVCENLDRLRVPITKRDRKPGPIPYYGASGAVDQVADFIFDENLLLVSEDGANLLARTYPIAFSIAGQSWVNNHAHVLRFETMAQQRYAEIYLNSISLESYVTGMAQPKLNQKALNNIPIPMPDVAVMRGIVELQVTGGRRKSALAAAYTAQLADLATLRQSVLARAFRGELT